MKFIDFMDIIFQRILFQRIIVLRNIGPGKEISGMTGE